MSVDAPAFQVDASLLDWNTLRLPARARYAQTVASEAELVAASDWAQAQGLPLLPLGQGSNVVMAGDFPGVVVRLALPGIDATQRGEEVLLDVGAGESWHGLVQHCLQRGWHGLENLTLIPGLAGAAPVQNIGAYGVELSRFLVAVRGWDRVARRFRELDTADCALGYRDSLFKHALRDRFIITRLRLRLSTRFEPVLDYPVLAEALAEVARPDASAVEHAVRRIRQSKLPDPATLPNAGSLFKNPVLPPQAFIELRGRHPDLPGFPQGDGVKVPAAWLLERAGWKGRRQGGVGMHEHQALVLVHYGGASGTEVLAFIEAMRRDIVARFGVTLDVEPRVYGCGRESG